MQRGPGLNCSKTVPQTFVIRKRKPIKDKNCVTLDISGGQEETPIPVFNAVNKDKLPAGFEYLRRSVLVGAAEAFVPGSDYPAADKIDAINDCPCVLQVSSERFSAV